MASRLELQKELEALLGSRNVYFQPPETIKLNYPCIIYEKQAPNQKFADDKTYLYTNNYKVMCITKNPDDLLPEKVMKYFSMCNYSSRYVVDNLYHDVFSLYY